MTVTLFDAPSASAPARDPAGARCTPIGAAEIASLERILQASGFESASLHGRYSVVFVFPGIGAGRDYPEFAGCTAEVCTFANEVMDFARNGIQLIGLSTNPERPSSDFLSTLPFPVGLLPEDTDTELIDLTERDGRKYALRESFIVFPDSTGLRIGGVRDSVGHVRRCFDAAIEKRLDTYRRAILFGLEREARAAKSTVQLGEFLANGAGSISITRVALRSELVCKLADPEIVAEESGYIDRINRLLVEHGSPPLFPAVVASSEGERPGWYLMEAVDPNPLADRLFEDQAMTVLAPHRLHILQGALAKLANLHAVTFRREIPRVSRYHYLERFHALPGRVDFRDTFDLVFDDAADLEAMLRTTFVLEEGFVCRSYSEQMVFLGEHIEDLLQPVGAYLHGDVHLPNMLVADGASDIVFIDPRIVWDGNDVGDPGFGDPMYDYATLLHSLHFMTAALKAIEEDYSEALLRIDAAPPGLSGSTSLTDEDVRTVRVIPGLLRLTDQATVAWFTGWMEKTLPQRLLGTNWKARLHIGAANATLGWLKIGRCIRTRHAWLALFIAALYHLELGRRLLEVQPR